MARPLLTERAHALIQSHGDYCNQSRTRRCRPDRECVEGGYLSGHIQMMNLLREGAWGCHVQFRGYTHMSEESLDLCGGAEEVKYSMKELRIVCCTIQKGCPSMQKPT